MTAIKQPVQVQEVEVRESSKCSLAKDEVSRAIDILAYYGADVLFKRKGDASYSKAPINSNTDREDIRKFISDLSVTDIQINFNPDFDL